MEDPVFVCPKVEDPPLEVLPSASVAETPTPLQRQKCNPSRSTGVGKESARNFRVLDTPVREIVPSKPVRGMKRETAV